MRGIGDGVVLDDILYWIREHSARGSSEREGASEASGIGPRDKVNLKQTISSPDAPKPVGPYSAALRAGQLLFISGQIPIDPATGQMVEGDIGAQTRRVLENVSILLKAAGLSFAHVVRTTVFLADMNDFKAMNEVYAAFFAEPYPARSTIQAARLPRDARVEIDVIGTYEGR